MGSPSTGRCRPRWRRCRGPAPRGAQSVPSHAATSPAACVPARVKPPPTMRESPFTIASYAVPKLIAGGRCSPMSAPSGSHVAPFQRAARHAMFGPRVGVLPERIQRPLEPLERVHRAAEAATHGGPVRAIPARDRRRGNAAGAGVRAADDQIAVENGERASRGAAAPRGEARLPDDRVELPVAAAGVGGPGQRKHADHQGQ